MGIRRRPKRRHLLHPLVRGNASLSIPGLVTFVATEEEQAIRQFPLRQLAVTLELLVQSGQEEYLVDLGIVLGKLGKTEAAIEKLEQARLIGLPQSTYQLGRLMVENEQNWGLAIYYLEEALSKDPDHSAAQYYLGKAILGRTDKEKQEQARAAFVAYQEAGYPLGHQTEVDDILLQLDPENQKQKAIQAARQEGEAAYGEGDFTKSALAYEEAIELGDQTAYIELGKVYAEQGNFARALDAFQAAQNAKLSDPELPQWIAQSTARLLNQPQLVESTLKKLDAQAETQDEEKRWLKHYLNFLHAPKSDAFRVRYEGLLQEFLKEACEELQVDESYQNLDPSNLRVYIDFMDPQFASVQSQLIEHKELIDTMPIALMKQQAQAHYQLVPEENGFVFVRVEAPQTQLPVSIPTSPKLRDWEIAIKALQHIAKWDLVAHLAAHSAEPTLHLQLFAPDDDKPIESGESGYTFAYPEGASSDQMPRIRVKLINSGTERQFVSLLYLSSDFGINSGLLPSGCLWMEPGEETWALGGRAIMARVDQDLLDQGIRQSTEHFLVLASTQEFDPKALELTDLDEPEVAQSTRGLAVEPADLRSTLAEEFAPEQTDWQAHKVSAVIKVEKPS